MFSEEDLNMNMNWSDTMVALRMMCAQFPSNHKVSLFFLYQIHYSLFIYLFINIYQVSVKAFVLQSQLYSCLKDRTLADRQLEVLSYTRSNTHLSCLFYSSSFLF